MDVVILPCELINLGTGTDIATQKENPISKCKTCGRQFVGTKTGTIANVKTTEPAITYEATSGGCPREGITIEI